MDNFARKIEEKENLTIDNIHKASEFYDYNNVLDKAFDIYKEVVENLPTLPVKLLPRLRADFNKHNTLVAIDNNNEIVGVALLEKLNNPKEEIGNFGDDALKYCRQVFGYKKPIYEVEAIAVKPMDRRRGLGQAFYEAARKHSNNRCIAIVTEENINGQKTAISGGFTKIPSSLFNAPFTIENGVARLDVKNGTHIVKANLYSSKMRYSDVVLPYITPYGFM